MAQISPGDIMRIVVKFSHPYTSQIQNVFHVRADGTETVDDSVVAAGIQDFLGAFYGELEAYLSSAMSLIEWSADRVEFLIDHWEAVEKILTGVATITGFTPTAAGEVLPPGVAGLILARTDVPRHVGRKFVAPFTETANDSDGEASATVTAALAAAGGAFFDEYALSGYDLSLYPVILDVNQNIYRYVDSVVAKAAWAYQRRRKRYVGL
jgi:hypothetical protein